MIIAYLEHSSPLHIGLQALQVFIAFFVGLFPTVNPFSTVPLFLNFTRDSDDEERERIARLSARNAGIIMLVTMLVGGLVLEFLGISMSALRAAGGLVVAYLGFQMLFPQPGAPVQPKMPTPHGDALNAAFMPLAFPSLASPGTMAVILGYTSKAAASHTWEHKTGMYAIIGLTILAMSILAWVILRASSRITRWLGPQGLDAMSRLMGLSLVCIGIQFIADGVKHL